MNVMEKRLIIICAFCAAAMAAGCSKADIAPERQNNGGTAPSDDAALSPHQVISAALPGTRTSLSGTSVLWSAGDRISLFNEGGEPCTYTLIGEGGSTTGSFEAEGTPEEGYMYAVYPELQGRPDGKTAVTWLRYWKPPSSTRASRRKHTSRACQMPRTLPPRAGRSGFLRCHSRHWISR